MGCAPSMFASTSLHNILLTQFNQLLILWICHYALYSLLPSPISKNAFIILMGSHVTCPKIYIFSLLHPLHDKNATKKEGKSCCSLPLAGDFSYTSDSLDPTTIHWRRCFPFFYITFKFLNFLFSIFFFFLYGESR